MVIQSSDRHAFLKTTDPKRQGGNSCVQCGRVPDHPVHIKAHDVNPLATVFQVNDPPRVYDK